LKDIGKVQVFSARPSFEQLALLDTGPITNHVNFANKGNGKFAYTAIGGTNQVKVYQRSPSPTLVATIPVGIALRRTGKWQPCGIHRKGSSEGRRGRAVIGWA
jgi:hypothetical protein